MKTSVVAATLSLLLVPSLALAQTPAEPPAEASPNVALGLSLGVTAAGFGAFALAVQSTNIDAGPEGGAVGLGVLGVAAIGLGPTVGHWYAGDVWTRGLTTRLAGAAAASVGFSLVDAMCDEADPCGGVDDTVGQVVTVLGVAAMVVGSIDDIVTAPRAARRHNARLRGVQQLTVVPKVGARDAGVVVAGRF